MIDENHINFALCGSADSSGGRGLSLFEV